MSNRYEIFDDPRDGRESDSALATEAHDDPGASAAWVRPVLWVLLVILLSANVITQTINLPVIVSGAFGLAALVAITGLVVHHYKHRRS